MTETDEYLAIGRRARIEALLDRALFILPEIQTTVAKQDQLNVPNQGGGRSGHAGSQVPLNVDAMEVKWKLRQLIDQASRQTWEYMGKTGRWAHTGIGPETRQARNFARMLSERPEYDQWCNDLDKIVRALEQAIDRPIQIPLGQCTCGNTLTAHENEPAIVCHTCGEAWNVQDRKEQHQQQTRAIGHMTFTATRAAELLAQRGFKVNARQIRNWALRGRIEKVEGANGTEYELNKIIDKLAETA